MLPGLEYIESTDPKQPDGRTIRNDNWLNSLVLNILNTRARTDNKCPSPLGIYGHWSESYRTDNLYIGARFWNAVEKAYRNNAAATRAITSAVQADLSKLVSLKLVNTVHVEPVERGYGAVALIVTLTTVNTTHVLNLSGSFAAGEWVWE